MTTQVLDGTTWWLKRRDDMTVLKLTFSNISLVDDSSGSTRLMPTHTGAPAQLTIVFPPQAVLEQAYTPDPNHPGQVFNMPGPSQSSSAQFANESTLVLDLPTNGLPMQFTAAGLLAWAGLGTDTAQTPNAPQTALECVWGLAFRPAGPPPATSQVAWLHNRQPDVSDSGVTALWHTSLMWGDGNGAPDFSRADPIPLTANPTNEQQLDNYLTSLNEIGDPDENGSPPVPVGQAGAQASGLRRDIADSSLVAPLSAREVTLSALGATIDLTGHWDPPQAGSLTGYKHRAVLGRDEHVFTEQRGYLLPFGFPAQLQTVTTRICEFVDDAVFGAAILSKTDTVVLLDQMVTYPALPGLPYAGRQFPFRTVRVHERMATVSAPPLPADVDPNVDYINEPGSDDRYQFHLIAEDYGGNTIEFTAPAYFVGEREALNATAGVLKAAIDHYDAEVSIQPSTATGRIGLASDAPSDTMVDVTAIYLGAVPPADGYLPGLVAAGHLGAFPRVAGVNARIPAIDALSSLQPDHSVHTTDAVAGPELVWPTETNYLAQGLGQTGVYAQLTQPVAFLPPPSNGGGLASLNTPVVGLSQTTGLVGGPGAGQINQTGFDPAKFFPDPTKISVPNYKLPTLLGFIDLSEIVKAAAFGDGDRIPQITTALLYGPNGSAGSTPTNPPTLPTAVRTSVVWRPFIEQSKTFNTFATTAATALDLNTTTTISLTGGGPPVTDVRGVLSSFDLDFAGGLVTVSFDSLAFTTHAGAAPKLDVKISKVMPGGNAFAFFQQLLDNLPGAGNIPQIDYRDSSLVASYSLAIPSIPMGAFLMQNLAVSSSVTLPLDGRPVQASFGFASRDHPFMLTVSLLGGGGFLALTVVGDTLQELEAQLDFGAAASLDLIVASASVTVTAGIHLTVTNGNPDIDAFFRATGQVDLLGIISVSLEIYLALEYISAPQKQFRGTAEFTVRVQVAFFSQSLSFSVSRSFSAGSDPTFDIAFPTAAPWQQRCAAFAPMVAS
ncbi:MAG: hypothetical protein ACLP75_05550 [Mycobacterium sp.]|uniref:hypothetical protein n=1 Tax=Mycobacterium sp. TaxID=1785 RepID=UPI003F94E187